MRKLRFRCSRCEEVVVSADEVVLTSGASSPSSYVFRCPLCRSLVVERCSEVTARLLLLGGARTGPSPVPTGSPAVGRQVLGPGHIEELRRLLDRPDWLNLLRDAGA